MTRSVSCFASALVLLAACAVGAAGDGVPAFVAEVAAERAAAARRPAGADGDLIGRLLNTAPTPAPTPTPAPGSADEADAHDTLAELSGTCGVESHMSADENALEMMVSFLLAVFLLCTFLDWINSWAPARYRLPLSVVMFISGTLIGILVIDVLADSATGHGFDHLLLGVANAAHFAPHALFYIVLPPLLYESSSNMSWHVLQKVLPSSLILAGPGVIINTLFTSFFVKAAFLVGDASPSWEVCILLSAILSATDPVAVVAALKDLGAPEKLSTLVDGESLVNDGSAVVVTYVALDWVSNAPASEKFCPTSPPTAGCVIVYFLQVALGGSFIGLLAGAFLYYWLRMIRSDHSPSLETTSILTVVYGTFFVAEAMHTSGVLAVVCLGMSVAYSVRSQLSHEGRHSLHMILEQVCYVCNQIVFFVAGIITVRFMWRDTGCSHDFRNPRAWGELAGLYVAVHVSRAAMIAIFSPILQRLGYGVSWKEFVFLVYGGLRGAIALVMGLVILENEFVAPEVKQMLAFHISGIVLLTLFINGLTVDNLYQFLKMYPEPAYKTTYLRKVCDKIEAEVRERGVIHLSHHWFFSTVNFSKIMRCVPNFRHIKLDDKLHAVPIHIESVETALMSLQDDAEKKHAEFEQARAARHPPSPAHGPVDGSRRPRKSRTFMERWQKRHSPCEEIFNDLMSSTLQLRGEKDTMEGLGFSAEGALELQDVDDGGYCSAKSLQDIGGAHGENLGFSVTIHQEDHVGITVGLLERPSEPARLAKYFRGRLQGAFHFMGLNCVNGHVVDSGPHGEFQEATQIGPVLVGDTVHIEVVMNEGAATQGASHIMIEVHRGSEEATQKFVYALKGERVPLDKLFPAMKFHQEHTDEVFESVSEVSGAGGSDNQEQLALDIGTNASPRPSEHIPRNQSTRTFARAATSALTGTLFSRRNSHCAVFLSYQPQLASDSESINGMFRVFFNTLKNRYEHMFEHGLLNSQAYYWLTNAADNGVDCANDEVNAKRFSHFARDKSHPMMKDLRARKLKSALCGNSSSGMVDEQEGLLLEILEPLLVEYLSIEHVIGQSYCFERIADNSHFVSRLGYGYQDTNSKIETLWAFIETHTEALLSKQAVDKFPLVTQCLERLIDLAKSDLRILEELQPMRFFYGKNGLALRILLNKRRERLVKVTGEGFITPGEAEPFVKEFEKRIHAANAFHPRRALLPRCARRSRRTDELNAWDGVSFHDHHHHHHHHHAHQQPSQPAQPGHSDVHEVPAAETSQHFSSLLHREGSGDTTMTKL